MRHRRLQRAVGTAALGVVLLSAAVGTSWAVQESPADPTPAQQFQDRFRSWSGSALTAGFEMAIDFPGLLAIKPLVQVGAPFASCLYETGPSASALASPLYPGRVATGAAPLLSGLEPRLRAITVPSFPNVASANYPGGPHAARFGLAGPELPVPFRAGVIDTESDVEAGAGCSARTVVQEFGVLSEEDAVASASSVQTLATVVPGANGLTSFAEFALSGFSIADVLEIDVMVAWSRSRQGLEGSSGDGGLAVAGVVVGGQQVVPADAVVPFQDVVEPINAALADSGVELVVVGHDFDQDEQTGRRSDTGGNLVIRALQDTGPPDYLRITERVVIGGGATSVVAVPQPDVQPLPDVSRSPLAGGSSAPEGGLPATASVPGPSVAGPSVAGASAAAPTPTSDLVGASAPAPVRGQPDATTDLRPGPGLVPAVHVPRLTESARRWLWALFGWQLAALGMLRLTRRLLAGPERLLARRQWLA